jgi:hypothetical protein
MQEKKTKIQETLFDFFVLCLFACLQEKNRSTYINQALGEPTGT